MELQLPNVIQGLKFGLVGVSNTAIDFIVLNALMYAFPTSNVFAYACFKAISFAAACANSFAWNKWWVFRKHEPITAAEVRNFLAVSLVGLAINTVVSLSIFAAARFLSVGIPNVLIGNFAALCGTIVVLAWNFFGYKHFVFKK